MKRIFSLIALTAAMFAAIAADAATLSETDAGMAASRWARRARLGVRLSPQRSGTRRYVTRRGNVFYGIRLGASGSVIVGDDGGRARVLAFSREPLGDIPTNSPLYALVSRDLALRAEAFAEAAEGTVEDEADIDDLRVSPLVATRWGQAYSYTAPSADAQVRCYNYYTTNLVVKYNKPDGSQLAPDETYVPPCGCVATAMAQTLRYWNQPVARPAFTNVISHRETPYTYVGTQKPTLSAIKAKAKFVNKALIREACTYAWDKMIECPLTFNTGVGWEGDPVTDENCEAIGALCYDCGVAVGLEYDYDVSNLYIPSMSSIYLAISNYFGYTSAVLCSDDKLLTRNADARARAILANLDARRPTILLVSGNIGGHAVVADGYGFAGEKETPYVHLNMGWNGQCDIWYNLPNINVADNPERFDGFEVIRGVVYNIDPDQVGEIVSGRVTDRDGAPVAGLMVEACDMSGSQMDTAFTDAHGIYYFVLPPDAEGYDIFTQQGELVGDAYSGPVKRSTRATVGNSWGNDITLGDRTVRAGAHGFRDFRRAVVYAQRTGEPLVEVLRPCALEGDLSISSNLTIVATNSSPRLSPVVCTNGVISVAAGVRLDLSNIAFTTSVHEDGIAAVNVASNGVVAVAGTVIVDSISTADANSFVLAGPLECGIVVKCSVAKEVGKAFGVAGYSGATSEHAAYVVNGYDFGLAGAADGTVLKWAEDVPVPAEAAYVAFDGGSGDVYYRSFDQLIAGSSASGEIRLLRKCSLTTTADLAVDRVLMSGSGDGLVVKDGGFVVKAGATLTVTNIVVGGSAPNPLFTLGASKDSKGHLVLADGARIDGYVSEARPVGNVDANGGAVAVKYGSAKLLTGSVIDGCSTGAGDLYGGGVYLKNGHASLELAGGAISNCVAGGVGGGVYKYTMATVNVTAPSFVCGNYSLPIAGDYTTKTNSDIYLDKSDKSRFVLAGDASGGSIGVDKYEVPVAGDEFMTVSVDAETATNSASAFFSNDADLFGAVSDDASALVWKDSPSDGQCLPERAVAVVVYGDGETNYYPNVAAALSRLRGDATVFVATNHTDSSIDPAVTSGDWDYYYDVEIVHNVVIRPFEGSDGPVTITRCCPLDGRYGTVYVLPGASLTITNVVIKQGRMPRYFYECDYAAFAVDGGTMTMEDGAEIVGTYQKGAYMRDGSRAAGAVNVYNDGVFRMTGGAIRDCENYYWSSAANYSVGAGVLVDGGTAYFEGGSVTGCVAYRYAGVYIGNRGKAYVSGAFTAADSSTFFYNGSAVVDSNFAVQDLSPLILTGPLTGSVGYTEGIKASTNIFGEVGCELTDEVIASATNFHHDVTGALGAVATNSEGRAMLVWSSAFPAGEDSFEEDGVVYYRAEVTPPPPPPPVYTIHYVGGAGSSGTMEDTVCQYGKVYNLRKCTLSKSGSHFVGWAWNGRLYDDGLLIFNLSETDGDELDFVAVWVAD